MRRLLLSLLLILAAVLPAAAEPRVALVIGNSKYGGDLPRLTNPANDAELMAGTLKKLGFQVVKVQDADLTQMKRAIVDFGTLLQNAGPTAVGLFYYAGHGLSVAGENYLVPIKANIQKGADADLEAVDAEAVLKQMEFAGNALNIIILDACRNNPLSRGMRSADQGLARMDAPMGSFIAYSTAPGETAADGNGRNSPYTLALTKAMAKPGIPIEEAFRDARVDVIAATNKEQIPWESSSLTGAFSFNPGAAPVTEVQTASAAPAPAAPAAQPSASTSRAPTPVAVAPGKTSKDCSDCPEMVSLPAGKFNMGSPYDEAGRTKAEGPVTPISIAAFAIGKYPVTRAEFSAFIKASGYEPDDKCWMDRGGGHFDYTGGHDWTSPGFDQTDKDPVLCVSWADADAYAKWLAKKTGKAYRLPSESEWEYAARAGTVTSRYWNDDGSDVCSYANTADQSVLKAYSGWTVADCNDGHAFTAPVGAFKPNAFGLYDMEGNIRQWVADCWSHDLSGIPTNGKPRTSGDCSKRVGRGSTWETLPDLVRSAFREEEKTGGTVKLGFRVALGQ